MEGTACPFLLSRDTLRIFNCLTAIYSIREFTDNSN